MKRSFFQAAVVSILLYGCTTWTLTKRLEKKLDGNYARILRAILNKSLRQYPTRHQLCGDMPPITKTLQVRRTRHAGHCWRSRDELISDVLLWTPTYGRAKAGRPTRTYIQQLCEDTGYSSEDLTEAMNDWEKWRERVRDIRTSGTTWWWWWPTKKKDHGSEKDILRICQENLLNSLINLSKNVISQLDNNLWQFTLETLDDVMKKKSWKQRSSQPWQNTSWTTYFFDYVMLFVYKTQQRNRRKAVSSPYLGKVTSESLRTTEG